MKAQTCVLAAVLSLCSAGCGNLSPPNWWNPGPVEYQQQQATRFDPYPDPVVGPEVEGFRPREYDTPRADTHPERQPFAW